MFFEAIDEAGFCHMQDPHAKVAQFEVLGSLRMSLDVALPRFLIGLSVQDVGGAQQCDARPGLRILTRAGVLDQQAGARVRPQIASVFGQLAQQEQRLAVLRGGVRRQGGKRPTRAPRRQRRQHGVPFCLQQVP